ncbi:MAG: phytase [Bacteroidales bacterium]|jgi:3-phytase
MKTIIYFIALFAAIALLWSCDNQNQIQQRAITVSAQAETQPIQAMVGEDAADDPAIWVNPCNKANSAIIGTNKKGGLAVYDLDGKELFYYPIGKVNNTDVLHNFPYRGDFIDLVGTSNRSTNSINLLEINKKDRSLSPLNAIVGTMSISEVYGFCFYQSPATNKSFAFVNGKEGEVHQYELIGHDSLIMLQLVRSFDVGSQVEGIVADANFGHLYIAEETVGIWKYSAEPGDGDLRTKVAKSGDDNKFIAFDVEGLTIYYAAQGKGYLIASSQGNNSYALFNRGETNEYLFSFSITKGDADAVEETDGLDVINVPLGSKYPYGMLVVQDGNNKNEHGKAAPQNFKIVSWEKIARMVNPNLIMDNSYDPFCPEDYLTHENPSK